MIWKIIARLCFALGFIICAFLLYSGEIPLIIFGAIGCIVFLISFIKGE
jgi:hypothetical protein